MPPCPPFPHHSSMLFGIHSLMSCGSQPTFPWLDFLHLCYILSQSGEQNSTSIFAISGPQADTWHKLGVADNQAPAHFAASPVPHLGYRLRRWRRKSSFELSCYSHGSWESAEQTIITITPAGKYYFSWLLFWLSRRAGWKLHNQSICD